MCAAASCADVLRTWRAAAWKAGTVNAKTKVRRIATWAGWCSPCESGDRPLVLTRTGPGGLRAWLSGLGDDDRFLLLTCNLCGDWQLVPPREQDDPEVVLVEDEVHEAVAAVVIPAPRAGQPAATVCLPTPRAVVVPDLPAVSAEAVAAAARVLAAARAQTQRTAPARTAPLDRSRRTRNSATARRTERPAAARVLRPTATSIALATPSGSQVVLAPAG